MWGASKQYFFPRSASQFSARKPDAPERLSGVMDKSQMRLTWLAPKDTQCTSYVLQMTVDTAAPTEIFKGSEPFFRNTLKQLVIFKFCVCCVNENCWDGRPNYYLGYFLRRNLFITKFYWLRFISWKESLLLYVFIILSDLFGILWEQQGRS